MKGIKIRSYQSQFSCIGSDCEDPCCSGWNIPIYQQDRSRLIKVLTPVEMKAFVKENPIPQVQKINRSCMKLCKNGLCSIQKSFGHEYLPDVCASYPRFMGIHKHGTEVGGWLSCPEVVRLSLEYSGELHDATVLDRAITDIDIEQPQTEYERSFSDVRDWFLQRYIAHPNTKRFFLSIAHVVGLSPAFFHKGGGSFTDLVQRADSRTFVDNCEESDSIKAFELFVSCMREFSRREWPYPKPIKLLREALEMCSVQISPTSDQWELRYVQHDWNVRWYLHSPNLLFHWQATLFKLLLIRLLYQVPTDKSKREKFVEAVYSAERLVEHTSLKRDLYSMFTLPWSFTRWIYAVL
ncbi:MAG: hypothetical protein CL916_07885 [Deltaproteobacteria bacterium]|nr:hypothetical protein [Deltaproteobacteria bacterium]